MLMTNVRNTSFYAPFYALMGRAFFGISLCGFLLALPTQAWSQEVPCIDAPNSGATITLLTPDDNVVPQAIVNGWSCGAGAHGVATTIGELTRQKAMLDSQFEALQDIRDKIGNDETVSDRQRRKILDDTLEKIAARYQPIVMPLTKSDLTELETIEKFDGFRVFNGYLTNFPPAGLTDNGATALFAVRNCFTTSTLDIFLTRVHQTATSILELQIGLEAERDEF